MLNTLDNRTVENLIGTLLARKGVAHNLVDNKDEKRTVAEFDDTASDIRIQLDSTLHYDQHGDLDAMGDHLVVKEAGKVVFERTGGKVMIAEQGSWRSRIQEILEQK